MTEVQSIVIPPGTPEWITAELIDETLQLSSHIAAHSRDAERFDTEEALTGH